MGKCKPALVVALVLLYSGVFAQAELEKIIPLSPNAAAISKYGEVPVSHFTGIPNISVPVYHVKSKKLEFPIALSYHAGGNKVEEVPSWVGMGWSLTGAPMISRSVRGIPDEGLNGFFSELTHLQLYATDGFEQYNPSMSIKQLQDEDYPNYNFGYWWADYLVAVYKQETDPEADIFYFNLPSRSGKFFWDQVTDEFHTYPWTNMKINYSGNAFEIVDEDGTVYIFPASLREKTTVSGATQGEQIPTAWWASKMYDANKTDSIVFSYEAENQVNYILDGQIKTVWGTCEPVITGSTATTAAYTLSGITFNNGTVALTKETTQREDLSGGYALKKIEIFNTSSLLIKKMDFTYNYRSGSVPSNYSSTLGKRLMLQQVQESGAGSLNGGKYQFVYDTDIEIPHRKSMSQDHWGFFNGRTNTELTPSVTYMPVSGPPLHIAGADRKVYPEYTQFGILKKIIYPTGGYSEFDYETNIAYNPNLPPEVVQNMASLEFGLSDPGTDVFIDTFEIDVPSHYINAYEGGAIIFSEADYVGVDLNGYANTQAVLTVRGLDSWNSSIFYYITLNNTEFHLPNGRYEIKAVFDQDPPEYENFYFILTWNSLDSADFNTKVGGVRVKSIRSVDGVGKNQYKEYKYTTTLQSDTSSGDVFGTPFVVAYDDFWIDESTYCRRIFAQSNQFVVSHSGSFIGYRTVYEKIDSLGQAGLTEYKFTHEKDLTEIESPFPPAYTMEAFRGQPLKTSHFKRQGNDYIPVARTFYEYTAKIFDSLSTYCIKVKTLKEGAFDGFNLVTRPWFEYQSYDFAPAWSAVSVKTDRLYDQLDTNRYVQTVTNYEYSPTHFQLVKTSVTNSRNEIVETNIYYTPDVTLTGTAEDARQELLEKNVITAVLKQEKKVAGSTTEVIETQFKKYHSTDIVKPELVKVKPGAAPAETRIEFTGYDQNGNLLSQKKSNDVSQAYIWDYNKNIPIAEAINTTEDHIAYTSFEADGKGGWTFSGTPATDADAPTGKKVYDLSNGAVTRTISASNMYTITFWAKAATTVSNATLAFTGRTFNGYTFYEYHTNGSATSVQISGSHRIDELRLYPRDARMTTYTYEPLVGITSQCDTNNSIVYYEYDGLGRLVLIKDLFKNILKKYSYSYHDQ